MGRRGFPVLALSACIAAAGLMVVPGARALAAQDDRDEAARRILARGLREEKAYDMLSGLLKAAPMRLTGSPGAEAALAHMEGVMRELGFSNVHREGVLVNRWERGAESAKIEASARGREVELAVCALGGSIGTPPEGLSAGVLEVRSFQELRDAGDKARGKIVFFNQPMDRAVLEPFRAYGANAEQRVRGAAEAAKSGAAAVLIRSLTLRRDRQPHTGLMRYEEGVPRIPASALATEDADLLSARLREDPGLSVRLSLSCRDAGPVLSANLLGEIVGSERPGEVILVGGHLDAWDLSPGAHDDGAGCVHAIEALRLIQACGLAPKRTIRAVLFMDEEFGGTGGRFYAAAPERDGEKHLAAFESDRGGFLPLAVGIGAGPEVPARYGALDAILRSLGVVRGLVAGGGGVDIGPLAERGVLLGGLIPDAARYFDHHHSALDRLEAVHPRELELGAVALAVSAYLIAQDGI